MVIDRFERKKGVSKKLFCQREWKHSNMYHSRALYKTVITYLCFYPQCGRSEGNEHSCEGVYQTLEIMHVVKTFRHRLKLMVTSVPTCLPASASCAVAITRSPHLHQSIASVHGMSALAIVTSVLFHPQQDAVLTEIQLDDFLVKLH